MAYLEKGLRLVVRTGMLVGLVVMLAIMLLTVSNIAVRLSGEVIRGSYELSEIMMVAMIGFAIAYAGLEKSHIIIEMVTSRFSQRTRAILGIFCSLTSAVICGAIAWATILWLIRGQFTVKTDLLDVPYAPFQCIWVFGLIFLCLIFLLDAYKTLEKVRKE